MQKKTILIIDDSASMRAILTDMLEAEGYAVKDAADGHLGLKMVQEISADLIITDLSMPVMDGIQFLREAKKLARCRFIPIVVLTSEEDAKKLDEAKQAGAATWLSKPFKENQLRSMLKMVLG